MSDNVEHPSHYKAGGVETIEGIRAALGDAFLDYCRGNVLKYVWRCRHKGKLLEDLRKAAKYLEWAIEAAESEKPSEPQELAIPDGWRELEENEPLCEDDLFELDGEWVGHEYNPSGGVYSSRIHRRHIRKIETDKPEHVDGVWVEEADANASKIEPTEWIPKVGDRVRVNRPGRLSDGKIGVIVEGDAGEYTVRISGHNLTSRNLTADDLVLIEAAS